MFRMNIIFKIDKNSTTFFVINIMGKNKNRCLPISSNNGEDDTNGLLRVD